MRHLLIVVTLILVAALILFSSSSMLGAARGFDLKRIPCPSSLLRMHFNFKATGYVRNAWQEYRRGNHQDLPRFMYFRMSYRLAAHRSMLWRQIAIPLTKKAQHDVRNLQSFKPRIHHRHSMHKYAAKAKACLSYRTGALWLRCNNDCIVYPDKQKKFFFLHKLPSPWFSRHFVDTSRCHYGFRYHNAEAGRNSCLFLRHHLNTSGYPNN